MPIALKTTSLPDAVYEALRTSIVTIELAPGTLITETAVAVQYGVARPTAKTAIERLVLEGLLTRQAHRAARVTELSRQDITDVYAARALIEEAALRGLAETSVVPPAALSAQRDLVAAADRDDRPTLVRDDIAFHRALVIGHGSARLGRMHDIIMGEVELCIGQVQYHGLMSPTEIAQGHQRILDAVGAGDTDAAGTLVRVHIEGARDKLLTKYDLDHPGVGTRAERTARPTESLDHHTTQGS